MKFIRLQCRTKSSCEADANEDPKLSLILENDLNYEAPLQAGSECGS